MAASAHTAVTKEKKPHCGSIPLCGLFMYTRKSPGTRTTSKLQNHTCYMLYEIAKALVPGRIGPRSMPETCFLGSQLRRQPKCISGGCKRGIDMWKNQKKM